MLPPHHLGLHVLAHSRTVLFLVLVLPGPEVGDFSVKDRGPYQPVAERLAWAGC